MSLSYPLSPLTRRLIMDRSVCTHLLNLLDGSPRHSGAMQCVFPSAAVGVQVRDLAATGARLVMCILFEPDQPRAKEVWRVVHWDWKTGDLVRTPQSRSRSSHCVYQVFDRFSVDGSGLIRRQCPVAFLDEFRVVVSHHNNPSAAALVVFNTLVPLDHPNNVRRFMLPQRYLGQGAQVYLGHDRSLGAMHGDGHVATDPSQAILVMTPSSDDRAFLILRTQHLIEHACSMRTDVQIPWGEWGKDAVVMKNQPNRCRIFRHFHSRRPYASDPQNPSSSAGPLRHPCV